MDVSKSVALVTGGARGIGKEIILHLLEKGAKVSIVDILEEEGKVLEKECQNKYGNDRVKFMRCDVTDSEKLFEVFDCTKSIFGSLDIVCNNAGIRTRDPKMAKKSIQINLTAVVEGTYKAIEMMSTKNGGKGGVVVNMASAAGLMVAPDSAVYTTTKFGVVAFTRCMVDYKNEGVRVNCICPTFADTDMVRSEMQINPQFEQMVLAFGLVEISDIVKAVMRCVDEDDMVGNAILVRPKGVIKDVKFNDVNIFA